MCLLAPANCSGEAVDMYMSSLTVSDCGHSRVLHTIIEYSDNNYCSGPEVIAQMNHTTTGMDNESSESPIPSEAVQFIMIISVAVVMCVIMCIFCSLFIFVIGFLCHRCSSMQKHPDIDLQSPIYQEVFSHKHLEQIEIKENEAYGPLHLQ